MVAILYFVIIFRFNIALIPIDGHYFDAESSNKINCYRQNAQNYNCLKNRWRSFRICLSPELYKLYKLYKKHT